MVVAVAGAHGQIARILIRLLAEREDRVVGLIRNPGHDDDVREDGGEPLVCDLERAQVLEIAAAIGGADAVVFAAGAGPGSGAKRKATMDRDGAIKLADACFEARVKRYVMVSAVGAESPPDGDDVFSAYLRAKGQADEALQTTELDWTIVRPGRLTDGLATGRPVVSEEPERGEVSRADVAAVLADVLRDETTVGRVLYVNGPR